MDLIYLIVTASEHLSTALITRETIEVRDHLFLFSLKGKVKGLSEYKKHSKLLFGM